MAATLVDDRDRRRSMMLYEIVKTVHILSATVLLGIGLGTAWFMWRADCSGMPPPSLRPARNVVLADWLFTTPAIISAAANGLVVDLPGRIFVGGDLAIVDVWPRTCWRVRVGCRSSGYRSGCAILPPWRLRTARRFRRAIDAMRVSGSRSAGLPSSPSFSSSISWLRNTEIMAHPQEWLKVTSTGLYCAPGDFYIDPALPVERAVVTPRPFRSRASRP